MTTALSLEHAFVAALLAQAGSQDALDVLQEFDSSALTGYVSRVTVSTLTDLAVNRGVGLSPNAALAAVTRVVGDNEAAVEWLSGLDLVAGGTANLEKLAGELSRVRAAQDAEALMASVKVNPDNLDADLGAILSRISEIMSRVSDDRFKVESLQHYLGLYAQGAPVIPPENAYSVIRFGVDVLDDPKDGIVASRGTLGVIAAPTTWGKSVLVSALGATTGTGGSRVLIASLEQSREQVGMRGVASLVGDLKWHVAKGFEHPRQVGEDLWDASGRIHIMSPGSGTPWWRIEAAARRQHRTTGLDVLVVDYFTLLEPPSMGKQFSSAAAYGWISKAGKRLAQELNIAVVFVAQFNRQVAAMDQEPDTKDLKETGQLEQDADWIVFLWAPKKSLGLEPKQGPENRVSCVRKAKNRWGKVQFFGDCSFIEIDPTRDRVFPYVRETDAPASAAAPCDGAWK